MAKSSFLRTSSMRRCVHCLFIERALQAQRDVVDPWVLVAWFHFPNGWLVRQQDPERKPQVPKDFLDDEAAVLRAARSRNSTYVA